jgi:hypothetical protein
MTGQTGPQRLFATVEPWFEQAFAEHGEGLAVRWELGLCTLPHPTEQQRMISSLVLYAEVPIDNGLQRFANTVFISAGVDEAYASETVKDLLGNFRQKIAEVGSGFAPPLGVNLDDFAKPPAS